MRMFFRSITRGLLILSLGLLPVFAWAGQTGKIAGRVTDASTHEPLIGASVILRGTTIGTTTDTDGFYTINNIPPDVYAVTVSFVGYRKTVVENVQVRIDLTTQVDVAMQPEAVEASEVVIVAQRPLVQKDLTSSSVTVSSDELKRIPTENVFQVVNLQAGVVGGHFRGGRSDEVAYLVDGVAVNDPYNGAMAMQVDNNSIREMEVISGTFNAEYGQAMSGIVNIVTPEGSSTFHGGVSVYTGGYMTGHTDLFPNVGSISQMRTRNVQGNLSGYVPGVSFLNFFVSGRYYADDGYLFGKRVYNITDRTYPLIAADGLPVYDQAGNPTYVITATGDGAYVPMNPSHRTSFDGKLSASFGTFKASYSAMWDDNWNKYYDHGYAWAPDGIMNHYRQDWIHSLQLTHTPSANTYQTLKLGYNWFNYKGYLYADPFDPRYVDPSLGTPQSGYTFNTGGNQTGRYDRYTRSMIAQWALNSQITRRHKVGVGVEVRQHELYSHGMSMINVNTTVPDTTQPGNPLLFVVGYPQPGAPGNQFYLKCPIEASAYVQDKIEYDMMIINAGVRVDYFDANSSYPTDLRNPTKNPLFPGADVWKKATAKVQVSPRLGVSFPITDQGIIHFSYGHFFQIPSFDNLYTNSDYLVTPSSTLSNLAGNPDLDAQRTVMYEVGLQQVILTNIGLNFTVYYRDIRNLLGMEILRTYEGYQYARFVNRDYGNVKGFVLSLDRQFSDFFGIRMDYTYQLASGNTSDPREVYYNNQTNPPTESNRTVVPLNWDQRSTLNISVTVGQPQDWNIGLITQLGSGFPYTEDIRVSNGLRFQNGGVKPSTFNMDLRAEKTFSVSGVHLTAFALVYNLLDTRNELNVDAASGRANIDLYTYLAGRVIGLNTIDEYVKNPANISTPRQVRVGLSLDF